MKIIEQGENKCMVEISKDLFSGTIEFNYEDALPPLVKYVLPNEIENYKKLGWVESGHHTMGTFFKQDSGEFMDFINKNKK